MKKIFFALPLLVLSACASGTHHPVTASAAFNRDRVPSSSHPKDVAIVGFKQLLDAKEGEVASQVQALNGRGLKPSGEISAAFLGGSCVGESCVYSYFISQDFYRVSDGGSEFQSVAVIISANDEKASVKRVFAADEISSMIR